MTCEIKIYERGKWLRNSLDQGMSLLSFFFGPLNCQKYDEIMEVTEYSIVLHMNYQTVR